MARKIQTFETSELQKYYEVARGDLDIDFDLFSSLYRSLPGKDGLVASKKTIALKLLESLSILNHKVSFSEYQIKKFTDNPIAFNLKVLDEKTLFYLSKIKESQSKINEFFGHYLVCRAELDYLMDLYNEKMVLFDELKEKYASALKKIGEAEISRFSMAGVTQNTHSYLKKTSEDEQKEEKTGKNGEMEFFQENTGEDTGEQGEKAEETGEEEEEEEDE